MAKKKSEEYAGDSGDENEYGDEPNFEDPDGFVDDISDEGEVGTPPCYASTAWLLPCASLVS